MPKTFRSTADQISLLQGRGLCVDALWAAPILEKENYYKLINGYKTLFLDPASTPGNDIYIKGSNFSEIVALYEFDRTLRSIFFPYFLRIENNMKSLIAYEFSRVYGHDNYLQVGNFEQPHPGEKNKHIRFNKIVSLISKVQGEISYALGKNDPLIVHYMANYGYVPLWVLVNILSMGTMSRFYQRMKQTDQSSISKRYSIQPNEMETYLNQITLFRNVCAHERLYTQPCKWE